MGSGSWSPSSYSSYSASIKSKPAAAVFTSRAMKDALNPLNVIRESRDSADNPSSTPLIVGVDVTGSMGKVADIIAKESLGVLFKEVIDRKPITDPHVAFMAIGDVIYDSAPLQVSQFEADNRIVDQLTDIFVEGGGGGNSCESYTAAWYFAATHTVHDSILKRKKKGYLFTIGDEPMNRVLSKEHIKEFLGDDIERDLTSEELLTMVSRAYHVFHLLLVNEGHCKYHADSTIKSWEILGQNLLKVTDYTKVSEIIVSTMQVIEGEDAAAVAASWTEPGTAVVVKDAIKGLIVPGSSAKKAVVRM